MEWLCKAFYYLKSIPARKPQWSIANRKLKSRPSLPLLRYGYAAANYAPSFSLLQKNTYLPKGSPYTSKNSNRSPIVLTIEISRLFAA